jgi:hypothetical protein
MSKNVYEVGSFFSNPKFSYKKKSERKSFKPFKRTERIVNPSALMEFKP